MCEWRKKLKLVAVLFLAALIFPSWATADSMAEYEHIPPIAEIGVDSNVVLVMDYSGSMQFPAHYDTVFHGYDWEWDWEEGWELATEVAEVEGEAEYDPEEDYYGYFDVEKWYTYDSGAGRWILHTDEDVGEEDRIGYDGKVAGNLLNFLLTSRMDAAHQSLIGGNTAYCDEEEGYCILQLQGAKREEIDVTINGDECTFNAEPEGFGDWEIGDYSKVDHIFSLTGSDCDFDLDDKKTNVKVDARDRAGIIQNNAGHVQFSIIPYASDHYKDDFPCEENRACEGEVEYGGYQDNATELINLIEDTVPFGGTHTGEAMQTARHYLEGDYEKDGEEWYENKKDPYYEDVFVGYDKDDEPEYETQEAWCRDSFVVLISDGIWNGDVDPVDPAWNMHTGPGDSRHDDLREDLEDTQYATTYGLFAFGPLEGEGEDLPDNAGVNSMKAVSLFGNFKDTEHDCGHHHPCDGDENLDWPDDDDSRDWEEHEDLEHDIGSYYRADSGPEMASSLAELFARIRHGASAGTSLAAITEERSTGHLINQAVFYPEKSFDEDDDADRSVDWIGRLFAYWFVSDHYLEEVDVQNIREDSVRNAELDFTEDHILEFASSEGDLEIEVYEPEEDGSKGEHIDTYQSLDEVTPVWEAGEELRDKEAGDRNIYTAGSEGLTEFSSDNDDFSHETLGTEEDLFPDPFWDEDDETPKHGDLIDYLRGISGDSLFEDTGDGYRCRRTGTGDADGSGEGVWKLGDIMRSTPATVQYEDYSMVFTGANDGMLHAFRMGELDVTSDGTRLLDHADDNQPNMDKLGQEEWAFVPQSSLPYMRFLAHPHYSRINFVDLSPYIIQTEDERKILIGGMRFGGATGAEGQQQKADSVNPPSDTCDDPQGEDCVGRSSYFALDITDPEDPEYLWEFSHEDLGFSYSGPAHIQRRDDGGDGEWQHYVMFASGPTNYDGSSDQDLSFFVLDLFEGAQGLIDGDDVYTTNEGSSFGARLFTEGIAMEDNQTDYILVGWGKMGNNPKGGVMNIYTGMYDNNGDPDIAGWFDWGNFKNYVNTDNPVVSEVVSMKCFGQWHFYFGTGQYFDHFELAHSQNNHLYGVPFACDADGECDSGTVNTINDHSEFEECESVYMETGKVDGWSVELDDAEGEFLRERNYAKPEVTHMDTVLFNTAQPNSQICEFGGQSRAWARSCATGWAFGDDRCEYGTSLEDFAYLVQLSGGAIVQYTEEDFLDEDGNPRGHTEWDEGLPSEEGGLPMTGSVTGEMMLWLEK